MDRIFRFIFLSQTIKKLSWIPLWRQQNKLKNISFLTPVLISSKSSMFIVSSSSVWWQIVFVLDCRHSCSSTSQQKNGISHPSLSAIRCYWRTSYPFDPITCDQRRSSNPDTHQSHRLKFRSESRLLAYPSYQLIRFFWNLAGRSESIMSIAVRCATKETKHGVSIVVESA
jgi:hypothetical protein